MSIKVKVGGSKSIRSVPKQDATRTVVAAGEKKPVITPDSITLGVDTVGAYVRNIQEGVGLDVTLNNREDAEVTISHEITTSEVSSNNSILGIARNIDIDQFGHITAFYNSELNPLNFTSDGTLITAKDIVLGNTAITIGESTTDISGLTTFNVGNINLAGDTVSGPTLQFSSNNGIISVNGATISNVGAPVANTDVVTLGYLSGTLNTVPDPVDPTDAANKRYVDLQRDNILSRMTALAATTANLPSGYVFSGNQITRTPTGTLNIDGVTVWSLGDGLLVKDQTDATQNGHYELVQVGDAVTPWIFERSDLTNEDKEIAGNAVFVTDGTTHRGTGWVATVADAERFVLGTDDITYVQFQGAGTFTAGRGLSLVGDTEFEVDYSQTFGSITGLSDNLIITSDVVDVNSSGGLILPVGTTNDRPTPERGMIRYNTSDSRFEAYNGTTWSGLGGVVDSDQDTFIRAETSAGADGDDLEFFTSNIRRLIIDDQGDITYGAGNNRFTIDYTTGDASFIGLVDFKARTAMIVPTGFTSERPNPAEPGMLRFNEQTDQFEGYNGTAWGTLGGLKDSDQDTFIQVESSPGADNDDINFFTAGTNRMSIQEDGDFRYGLAQNRITFDYLTGDAVFLGAVNFNSTGAITIPNGATGQRPATADQGMIRYNTTDSAFEGYNGAQWIGLGGVIDADQDTKIIAETSSGADNDQLDFFTGGTHVLRINAAGNIRYGTSFNRFTVDYATGDMTTRGTLQTVGQATLASANVEDLTITQVVVAGTDGELEGTSDFTYFNGLVTVPDLDVTGDIDVTGSMAIGQLSVGDLDKNRVVFVGDNGRLLTDTTFRFNPDTSTFIVGGDIDVDGNLTIGGNLIIGDAPTDSITVAADFESDLVPNEIGNYSLGTIGKNWYRVYTPTIISDTEIVTIDGAGALKLPIGNRLERPTGSAGMIRFNSQDSRFEGYDGTRWAGLAGSVIDVDQDTKITAESSADIDRLEFFTQGTRRFFIESTGEITTDPAQDLVFDIGGNIDAGNTIITGVAAPVNQSDAVNLDYLENTFSSTLGIVDGPLLGTQRNLEVTDDPKVRLVNGLEVKAYSSANNSVDVGLTSPMAGSTGIYGNDGFTPRIRITEDGRIDFATEIPVELQANAIPDFTETSRDIIALMLEEGVQQGISVVNDDANDTMDFIVDDFDIILTGDVVGSARVLANSNTTISTSIDFTANADDRYVNETGDTMTGDLAVPKLLDAANTDFYIEPSQTSQIKSAIIGYGEAVSRLTFRDGVGGASSVLYAGGGKIGFLNNVFNFTAYADRNNSSWTVTGDTLAERFIDRNNQSYFLNPAGLDSVFNALSLDTSLTVGSGNLVVDVNSISTVVTDITLNPGSGTIRAANSVISDVLDPVGNLDVVNKRYLDSEITTSLANLVGGAGLTYDVANTAFSANVDDVTLEIVNDIIRVKDSGIANAKIANPFISFAAETGNTDIVSLGEVITFGAGEGINTQVSNNQILIAGELATTANIGVASFAAANFNVTAGEVTVAELDGGTF